MKKLFVIAYQLFYGATEEEAIEAYRTANQAYRKMIVQILNSSGIDPQPPKPCELTVEQDYDEWCLRTYEAWYFGDI